MFSTLVIWSYLHIQCCQNSCTYKTGNVEECCPAKPKPDGILKQDQPINYCIYSAVGQEFPHPKLPQVKTFNPTALRMAKTLWSFGRFRVSAWIFFLLPPLSPDQIHNTGAKLGQFFPIFRDSVYTHVGFSVLTSFHIYTFWSCFQMFYNVTSDRKVHLTQ